MLSSRLGLELNDCCYSPEMATNIIAFHGLYRQGFRFLFDNEKGSVNAFLNGFFYFEALSCNGIYETVMVINNLGTDVLHVDSSNSLDKAFLWHCRLGHVHTKRIAQLQKDGVLQSFNLRDNDDGF